MTFVYNIINIVWFSFSEIDAKLKYDNTNYNDIINR